MLEINSPIIFENDHFVVANKPANQNFHDEGDVNSGFFNKIKKQQGYEELYPVHRLDKMTSGLIIFAKNLAASQQFNILFEQHHIQKYYLAISLEKPTKKQGWIKGDMVKSRRSAYKLLRTTNNPAISLFFSYGLGKSLRLFIVKPLSGKTHQIRVALKSIGSPITGDAIYNPSNQADRGYLHAYALKFTFLNEEFSFVCPPTDGDLFIRAETSEAIDTMKQPWKLKWPK